MSQADQDRRIDYIEFPATDIAATKRFYAQAFGWEFEDYGPDYAAFRDGRMNGGFAKSDEAGAGKPLVVLYAADLAAAETAVKDAGGTIIQAAYSFPGGRRFHFADPNGNELAVWSDA
ncbi:MAG: VOC family protein [Bryobacterales bacterium]